MDKLSASISFQFFQLMPSQPTIKSTIPTSSYNGSTPLSISLTTRLPTLAVTGSPTPPKYSCQTPYRSRTSPSPPTPPISLPVSISPRSTPTSSLVYPSPGMYLASLASAPRCQYRMLGARSAWQMCSSSRGYRGMPVLWWMIEQVQTSRAKWSPLGGKEDKGLCRLGVLFSRWPRQITYWHSWQNWLEPCLAWAKLWKMSRNRRGLWGRDRFRRMNVYSLGHRGELCLWAWTKDRQICQQYFIGTSLMDMPRFRYIFYMTYCFCQLQGYQAQAWSALTDSQKSTYHQSLQILSNISVYKSLTFYFAFSLWMMCATVAMRSCLPDPFLYCCRC